MAKSSTSYVCQSCGAVSSKWAGKCESCGEWNSITEERAEAALPKGLGAKKKGRAISFAALRDEADKDYKRHVSGIKEFDRVTGGGLVPGSATLIGGDPGIGKSTLLLQAVCALSKGGARCVYISGEEAVDQVRMRARRLGLGDAPVELASATSVRDIVASIDDPQNPVDILVIDSIQTMFIDTIESAPGTVAQVRTSAQEIIRTAKARGIAAIFVGHVTKDGQIAGPRVLEHMVDTVLYFEGERSHQFRILRSVKNRFGPTDEIGVFEMAHQGLVEVENPSALFLSQRQGGVAGSAVLAALEGTRPMLVEVQALVAPSNMAAPRRAVLGWDPNRLAMIVAVMEARCGLRLSGNDIFLNIAGGIRINEPAADLAVAAALASAMEGRPLPPDTVFFGEIGLAGEVRQVAQPDLRMKEAAKLGFDRAVVPKGKKDFSAAMKDMITITETQHVQDIADLFASGGDVRKMRA
ncbi:MAG TPA: DNA repair protein RadA [Rhodospirillaceae bacterium]|nr:DNA repair protein RadA [Rhodospirillaceae bacterium]